MIKPKSGTASRVFSSPEAIGKDVAEQLLAGFENARKAGRQFVLGCPTGRTPRPIYGALAKRIAETRHDISHLIIVMMDEYLVKTSSGFEYASPDAPWSCHNFVQVEITRRWNQDLPRGRRLEDGAVWFPDPSDPAAYDKRISGAGGVDFFILASGASDGHVAFNPPGSPRESRTRIIELPESTRRDNLQTFPAFGSLASVPTHGISVGIATISSAKRAAMVLWGKSKAVSFDRVAAVNHYEPDWPATVIHECSSGEILSDTDAASRPGKP